MALILSKQCPTPRTYRSYYFIIFDQNPISDFILFECVVSSRCCGITMDSWYKTERGDSGEIAYCHDFENGCIKLAYDAILCDTYFEKSLGYFQYYLLLFYSASCTLCDMEWILLSL